jgi:hypothetical protein
MAYECLKADGRRRKIVTQWEEWLVEADRLYCEFLRVVDDSPFDFHEVAAVGFLSCAAARSGFLTLNEYQLIKHSRTDRRRKVPGRADLWMIKDDVEYSFEFKRAWYNATRSNLKAMLQVVRGDIRSVPADECHHAAGGLIAYVNDPRRDATYRDFIRDSHVHMAYRIGPEGESGAFLYFSFRER